MAFNHFSGQPSIADKQRNSLYDNIIIYSSTSLKSQGRPIIKYSIILFTAALITGCGGGSSNDSQQEQSTNDQPVMSIDIPASLKGREDTPELASLSVSNGDTVVLNSMIHGSQNGGESFEVIFEALDQQHILIQPVDYIRFDPNRINVSSLNVNPYEYYIRDNRNEVSFIATDGKYRAQFNSDDSLEFSFKIMEASRESMGFSEHDYLVRVEGLSERDCTGKVLSSYSKVEYLVINWRKGEFIKLSDYAAPYGSNFIALDEASFQITRGEGDPTDGYSNDYQHYVSISPENGYKISYNFRDILRTGSGEAREICVTTYRAEGEIII